MMSQVALFDASCAALSSRQALPGYQGDVMLVRQSCSDHTGLLGLCVFLSCSRLLDIC